MAAPGGSPTVPSLPPPRAKSPPQYPDLYGKRRELAKVVMLEREIGFLQEELKSVESLQPASSCIKEVADYVIANPEPLIPTSKKSRKSCRFWKWICGKSCFSVSWSWICCCRCCRPLKTPSCCGNCSLPDCCSCFSCSLPKCSCSCNFRPRPPQCFKECSCCPTSCSFRCPSCPDCSCCCKCACSCFPTKCSCPKCATCTRCCCSCGLNNCYSCCLCR